MKDEAFSSSSDTPCDFRPLRRSAVDLVGASAAAAGVLQDFIEELEETEDKGAR